MKKAVIGLMVVLLVLVVTIATSTASTAPSWTKLDVIDEGDYIYGVASMPYSSNDPDNVVDYNYVMALQKAKAKVRAHMKLPENYKLKGYQPRAVHFTDGTDNEKGHLYVLIAVTKKYNDIPAAEAPDEDTSELTNCSPCKLKLELKELGVLTIAEIPKEWWMIYRAVPSKNPTIKDFRKNVFIIGDMLFSVGRGYMNTTQIKAQQKPGAVLAAQADARRNILAVTTKAIQNISGSYTIILKGRVRKARIVPPELLPTNPKCFHGDKPQCFVIVGIPLEELVGK